jgi:hypothetical protein
LPEFKDLSWRAGLGEVAGAASARGARATSAVTAEVEKNIFQRVTKVEKQICNGKEWLKVNIY